MLINSAGRALTQKQQPRLATLRPSIEDNTMIVSAADCLPLRVPLVHSADEAAPLMQSRVCADNVEAEDCGDAAADWFGAILGHPCRLVRLLKGTARECRKPGASAKLSFANEAQYLAISQASLDYISTSAAQCIEADVFRSNMVLDGHGLAAFEEDHWKTLQVLGESDHDAIFTVVGRCVRCRMICIDQQTGDQQIEPLETLSRVRRDKGKTYFGVLLSFSCQVETLRLRVGLALEVLPRL
jgi:uncharacterized protein YcbX